MYPDFLEDGATIDGAREYTNGNCKALELAAMTKPEPITRRHLLCRAVDPLRSPSSGSFQPQDEDTLYKGISISNLRGVTSGLRHLSI
jgi:hypothetical protein